MINENQEGMVRVYKNLYHTINYINLTSEEDMQELIEYILFLEAIFVEDLVAWDEGFDMFNEVFEPFLDKILKLKGQPFDIFLQHCIEYFEKLNEIK